MRGQWARGIGGALIGGLVVLLAGCATTEVRPMDLFYTPPPGRAAPVRPVTVGVAQFTDVRAERRYIGRVYATTPPVIRYYEMASRPVPRIVAEGVARALEAAGYRTNVLPDVWDLNPATLQAFWPEVVVGGKVEEFWAETSGDVVTGPLRVRVRFTVAVAARTPPRLLWSQTLAAEETATATAPYDHDLRLVLTEVFQRLVDQIPTDLPRP
ncbi:MAG: hypothetical protein HYV08_09315 [Deltaproteobacteria bacterium]|nr:hypothetical protein [Deltaproteobacteria bacterium]